MVKRIFYSLSSREVSYLKNDSKMHSNLKMFFENNNNNFILHTNYFSPSNNLSFTIFLEILPLLIRDVSLML